MTVMHAVTDLRRRCQRGHSRRRRAPALRGVDARDGLPPPGRVVQHRQEGRASPSGASSPRRARSRRSRPEPGCNVRADARPRTSARPGRPARRRRRAVLDHRLARHARGGRVPAGLPVALRATATTRTCRPATGPRRATTRRSLAWLEGRARAARRRGVLRRRADRAGGARGRDARGAQAAASRSALHTGGAYPRRLDEVIADVDWVGLDVKAPASGYAAVTGVAGSGARRRGEPAARRGVGGRLRGPDDRASGSRAGRCARASRRRARRRSVCAAGCCSRSGRRAARTRRWSPRRRAARPSASRCSRDCASACRAWRCEPRSVSGTVSDTVPDTGGQRPPAPNGLSIA